MARWWRLEAIGGTVRWRAVGAGAAVAAVVLGVSLPVLVLPLGEQLGAATSAAAVVLPLVVSVVIGAAQSWVGVAVGGVGTVAVAQLVARLDRARCEVDRLAHRTGRLCGAPEEVERLRRSLVGAVSHDLGATGHHQGGDVRPAGRGLGLPHVDVDPVMVGQG